jgi:tripartite-type tricarboxylate transporter receptor subunit TctC
MLRAVLVFALLCCGAAAWSQPYPAKAVRLVVPYAVGGSADVYGRVLAAKLSETLGHPVVVENRPGGGAVVGTDAVAKSAPDGYTILMMSNTHAVNETLIPKKPYELMRDLAPVTGVNYQDLLLVVHPSVAAKDVKELIALAKKSPGKLNYASSGPGTPYHMAGELFKYMAGVDIVHIPHKGSDQARTAVLGHQVDMMFDAISTMVGQVHAGKLKAIATTGKNRSTVTPDVPTVAESGVAGYEAPIWLGLMAPAATPKPIIEKLNAEVVKVLQSPDIRQTWAKQGTLPMPMKPDEFERFLRADIEKWGKLVRATGMKVD